MLHDRCQTVSKTLWHFHVYIYIFHSFDCVPLLQKRWNASLSFSIIQEQNKNDNLHRSQKMFWNQRQMAKIGGSCKTSCFFLFFLGSCIWSRNPAERFRFSSFMRDIKICKQDNNCKTLFSWSGNYYPPLPIYQAVCVWLSEIMLSYIILHQRLTTCCYD